VFYQQKSITFSSPFLFCFLGGFVSTNKKNKTY